MFPLMLQRSRIALAGLLLLSSAMAATEAYAQALPKTLLWEISGNGLERPSYLYGTMHRRDRRVFRFNDSVMAKLHQCSTFASELDMNAVMREMLQKYLATEDGMQTFMRAVSGDTSDITESELPLDAADSLAVTRDRALPDSIAAAIAAAENQEYRAIEELEDDDASRYTRYSLIRAKGVDLIGGGEEYNEGDRPTVVDSYLYGAAMNAGLRLVGLESMLEQLSVSEEMTTTRLREMPSRLRRAMRRNPLGVAAMMADYYNAWDLQAIGEITEGMLTDRSYSAMFVNRNRNMVARAVPLVQEGPTFIAVGAGHLPGPNGLIALFRARGYTVRPVIARSSRPLDSLGIPAPLRSWVPVESAEGAFAVEMPQPPVEFDLSGMASTSPISANEHAFVWPDLGTGVFYSVSYADYTDLQHDNDSQDEPLIDMLAARELNGSEIVDSSRLRTTVHGLPAIELKIGTEDGRHMFKRLVQRGPRVYTIEAQGVGRHLNRGDINHFLASFRPMPVGRPRWRTFTADDSAFSTQLPAAPYRNSATVVTIREYRNATHYVSVDPFSGSKYSILDIEYPEYYRITDTIKFVQWLMGDSSRTIAVQRLAAGNALVYEPAGALGDTHAGRRMRVIISGTRVQLLERVRTLAGDADSGSTSSATPAAESNDDAFFNSFTVANTQPGQNLFTDKSDLLFRTLARTSGPERVLANAVLRQYPLRAEHLPRIHELLRQRYADDNNGALNGGTRAILLSRLAEFRDSATIGFILRLQPDIVWYRNLTSAAAEALFQIGTPAAQAGMMQLLQHAVEHGEFPELPMPAIFASIERRHPLFPGVLALLRYNEYHASVYRIAAQAIDAGVLDRSQLSPYRETILADAHGLLNLLKAAAIATKDENESENGNEGEDEETSDHEDASSPAENLQHAITLLGYLPDTAGIGELLNAVLDTNVSDMDLRFAAVVAQARGGHPVHAENIELIARDPLYRLPLLATLPGLGRADLMPARYRTQQSIAEAQFAEWLQVNEYDADARSCVCIGEREITVDGKTGRAFLFAYENQGAEWRVGISGLQPLDRDCVDTEATIQFAPLEETPGMTAQQRFDWLVNAWKRSMEQYRNWRP